MTRKRVAPSPIPDDVRRFVLASALTVPDVEALLIFHECGDAGCESGVLASRLYITQSRSDAVVAKLTGLRAIEPVGDTAHFVYRPNAELSAVLDALRLCYGRYLVQVAELIHSTEAQSAQTFADAFRIRKET